MSRAVFNRFPKWIYGGPMDFVVRCKYLIMNRIHMFYAE